MTSVSATRLVHCPFSAVIQFAEEYLREDPDFSLAAVPGASRTHCGSPTALLLSWHPFFSGALTEFHGTLSVRPQGCEAWMHLEGAYEAPVDIQRRIVGAIFGRLIVRRTIERLLSEIAQRMERRWHAFRGEDLTA